MATPSITFNTSTGSDSQASGSGTPSTAVFGTNASFSGSVFTLDGSPDLSTVPTDGTGVLWCQTSTGRQFFTINAKDNGAKTVTTDDAPAGTSTGRTWAIGGKRNAWNNTQSRLLFTADAKAGWTIVTETDQSLTASSITLVSVGDTTTGPLKIVGSGGVRTISQGANAACFAGAGGTYQISSLKFTNTQSVSKTSSNGISASSSSWYIRDCTFGDVTNTLLSGISNSSAGTHHVINCEVVATTSHGVSVTGNGAVLYVLGCAIHGATGSGRGVSVAGNVRLTVEQSLIYANAGAGIFKSSGSSVEPLRIVGNTIHGNSGDGIDLSTTDYDSYNAVIVNNNLTGNGGYGLNGKAITDAFKLLMDFNNYGTGSTANTSGRTSGSNTQPTPGSNDLSVDPGYANAAAGNFASGSGVWAKGFPGAGTTAIGNGNSATISRQAIGAFQPGRGLLTRQPR